MHFNLHEKPLTTDQITSVTIDENITEQEWELIQVAVGHGYLHPNTGTNNPDEMPWREGTFHLAYALAPHFLLLPRRGKAVKLSTIKKNSCANILIINKDTCNDDIQPSLFDEGSI